MFNLLFEDSFYVYLTNKTNKFKNFYNSSAYFNFELPEILYLNHEFSVGLVELHMRKDWQDIEEKQKIEFGANIEIAPKSPVYLNAKKYVSEIELINDINDLISSDGDFNHFTQIPKYSIDNRTSKVILTPGKCFTVDGKPDYKCFPILSQQLSEMLGFVTKENARFDTNNYNNFLYSEPRKLWNKAFNVINAIKFLEKKLIQKNLIFKTPNSIDLEKSSTQQKEYNYTALKRSRVCNPSYLNIFTNFVQPSIQGNEYKRHLARVDIKNNIKFNEMIFATVSDPAFHRVDRESIKNISIYIEDDIGRFIAFEKEAEVSIVLEFRKT